MPIALFPPQGVFGGNNQSILGSGQRGGAERRHNHEQPAHRPHAPYAAQHPTSPEKMAAKTVATIRALSADWLDFSRNCERWENGDREIREQVKQHRLGARENGAGGFIAQQNAAEREREGESKRALADYHGWRTQIGSNVINSAPIRLLPDNLMAILGRKAPDPLDMPPRGTGSRRVPPKRTIAKKPRQPLRRAPEAPAAAAPGAKRAKRVTFPWLPPNPPVRPPGKYRAPPRKRAKAPPPPPDSHQQVFEAIFGKD